MGLRLKAAWIGRLEQADEVLLWVRVDWLRAGAGRPAGKVGQGVPDDWCRGG